MLIFRAWATCVRGFYYLRITRKDFKLNLVLVVVLVLESKGLYFRCSCYVLWAISLAILRKTSGIYRHYLQLIHSS